MYLYWFERIIRKMSGDSSWALPYWNYTSASERQLPSMFRVTTSELYTVNRNSAMNSGAGSLPGTDVQYSTGFAETDYYIAQGDIEGTPHDAVHVDMGGWMGSVPTAAQDPIFYLHHANIDRLWNLFLAQGGGRSDPTSDSTWTGVTFTFFDENGSQVKMTPCDVLEASAQLNYTYEGEPPQVTQTCGTLPPWIFREIVLLKFPFPPNPIDGDPYTLPVDISSIVQKLESILQNPAKRIYLELQGVTTDTQPGATWEVYVGLPAGVAPNPSSPFYVGKMALFGAGVKSDAHMTFHPASLRFYIETAISGPLANGQGSIPITFVPRGILINGHRSTPRVKSPVTVTNGEIIVVTRSRQ